MSKSNRRLPQDIQKTLVALAFVLAPPAPGLDMSGVEESIVANSSRLIFEFPKLFRWGLTWGVRLFEWFPVLFGYGLLKFSSLSLACRRKYVDQWAHNRIIFIREFFITLKALVFVVYFSDKRIWHYIGYDPEPHLKERIQLRETILKRG